MLTHSLHLMGGADSRWGFFIARVAAVNKTTSITAHVKHGRHVSSVSYTIQMKKDYVLPSGAAPPPPAQEPRRH